MKAQVLIADGLPGCLPVTNQVGVVCGGGTTFFGVNPSNQFQLQNIDGEFCCSFGGDFNSYFEFATLDISCFHDISFNLDYSAQLLSGGFEDNSPTGPIFDCTGTLFDNSHDQMIFFYSIDGGPFIQSLYVHGTTVAAFTGNWSVSGLNGNTLQIRVYASNKAEHEIFYFEDLEVFGTPEVYAGDDVVICYPGPANLNGICNGNWSGGAGVFSSTNNPVTTYTPAISEQNSAVTLTYTMNAAYTGCPRPFDQVQVDIDPAPTVDPPADITVCAGDPVSIVFTGTGTSYDWTNSNTAIGLGASGTGDINFTATGSSSVEVGTITVTPNGSCPGTSEMFMVTVNPPSDASFTFDDFCEGDSNGPTNIATGGGTFTFNPVPSDGATINPSTGVITGGVAGVTYTVVYSITSPCPGSEMVSVTVNPPSDASFTFDDFCEGDSNGPTNIATGGGTFTFNPMPSDGATVNPSTGVITGGVSGATYTVVYTTTDLCPGTEMVTVTVNPPSDASFTFDDFCEGDTNGPTNIATGGGTFTFNPMPSDGATINPSTGVISDGQGGTSYTVQYTTAGSCPGTSTQVVMVTNGVNVVLGALGPYCRLETSISLPTTQSGVTGVWSGMGVSGNIFNPSVAGPGMWPLTFTPNAGQCASPNSIIVEVLDNPIGNLVGDPVLCPGQCGDVMFNFSGGTGLYDIVLNFTAGFINLDIPIVGVSNTTVINICLNNGAPFDPSTNTINIPTLVPTGTYGLTLLVFSSNPGGLCTVGEIGNPGMISLTINSGPTASTTSMSLCDLNQDGQELFDLTSLENTVKNNVAANTVTWFTDMAALNPILNPSSFIATNGTTVFAQVSDPDGCSTVVSVNLNLTTPTTPNIANFSACINDPIFGLPTTVGGVTGSWSGANVIGLDQFDPTGLSASSYPISFTPDVPQCALPVTVDVVISSGGPVSLATPLETVCLAQGSIILDTNQGGINGVWSGNIHLNGNTFDIANAGVGTQTITFTPTGSATCFEPNTTTIVIIDNTALTPVTFMPVCMNGGAVALGNDVDGNFGTWSGVQVNGNSFDPNTSAGIYTLAFLPNDVCAIGFTTDIEVLALTTLTDPNYGPTCVNGSTIILDDIVDGINGSWTYNGNPITEFDPSVFMSGDFTLVFTPEIGACAQSLTISINVGQISAGADNTTSLCQSDAAVVDLNAYLTGATIGGDWEINGTTVANPSAVDLATYPIGTNTFMYIIDDVQCGRDTALVSFTIGAPNMAGLDSFTSLCSNGLGTINLNSLLGPIDADGTWMQPNGISIDFTDLNVVNISSLTSGIFEFDYIVAGDLCAADTSTTTIDVSSFQSAGADDMSTLCLGSSIDLLSLINTSNTTGNFLNPTAIPGLTGSIWNTNGLLPNTYTFYYEVTNTSPCPIDSATITIALASSVLAGSDQIDVFCEGDILNLNDYVDSNASSGGVFYYNNTVVTGGAFVPSGMTSYLFMYIVGDDITCPKDTALITLSPLVKPTMSISNVADVCEGQCTDILINHSASIGSKVYLTLVDNNGQQYKSNITTTNPNTITISICAATMAPYTFTQLPSGLSFTLRVDSIVNPMVGCTFTYTQFKGFSTKETASSSIIQTLCLGQMVVVGNDVYTSTNPSGTTIFPSIDPTKCDSIVVVDLTYVSPSPLTNIVQTTCDQAYSVTVGNTVFNAANPAGQVILTNIQGCDSLINVSLTFSNFSSGNFTDSTCDENATYVIGSTTFDINNRMGTATLPGASIAGCDSLVSVNITYLAKASGSVVEQTCDENYSIQVGNVMFNNINPIGNVTLSGQAANGCDSVVSVALTYLQKASGNYNFTTCDDTYTYDAGGGNIFSKANPSGQVTLLGSAANGCDSTVNVQLNFLPFSFIQTLDFNCDGTDPTIKITFASQTGPYFIAIDNQTAIPVASLPFQTTIQPGSHTITVTTAQGCKDSLIVIVDDNSGPSVSITQTPLSDGQVQLQVVSPPNAIYNLDWTPSNTLSCNDCYDPIANPTETTTYTLEYMYGSECSDSKQVTIEKVNTEVVLPNIFSPNGDGTNDWFYVQLPGSTIATVKKMSIYDRWGNLVFVVSDVAANIPTNGWNGEFKDNKVVPGVFVFVIELEFEGNTNTVQFKGDITVTN